MGVSNYIQILVRVFTCYEDSIVLKKNMIFPLEYAFIENRISQ